MCWSVIRTMTYKLIHFPNLAPSLPQANCCMRRPIASRTLQTSACSVWTGHQPDGARPGGVAAKLDRLNRIGKGNSTTLQKVRDFILTVIIKHYLNTVKSRTVAPFSGVYIH